MVAVVDETLYRCWIWPTAIGVYFLLHSAVEGIVGEVYPSSDDVWA
jgi:hypothetical protein